MRVVAPARHEQSTVQRAMDWPYLGAGLALAGGLLSLLHKALRCDEYQAELKVGLSQYRALAVKYDQVAWVESIERARILVGIADERRHDVETSRRTAFNAPAS